MGYFYPETYRPHINLSDNHISLSHEMQKCRCPKKLMDGWWIKIIHISEQLFKFCCRLAWAMARKAEKELCWSTNTMKSGSLSKGAPHWPEMRVLGFSWWDSLWLTDGADNHSEWAGGWWSLPPGGCWLPWQNWWCRRIRRSEAAPLDCAQSTGDKTMHFAQDMTFHWSGFEVWMLWS